MRLFLVVQRYMSDDLPLRIFPTREEAKEFIADEPGPGEAILGQFSACEDNDPICYMIVEFVNGWPVPEQIGPDEDGDEGVEELEAVS